MRNKDLILINVIVLGAWTDFSQKSSQAFVETWAEQLLDWKAHLRVSSCHVNDWVLTHMTSSLHLEKWILLILGKIIFHIGKCRPRVTARGKRRLQVLGSSHGRQSFNFMQWIKNPFLKNQPTETSVFVIYESTRGQRTHRETNLPQSTFYPHTTLVTEINCAYSPLSYPQIFFSFYGCRNQTISNN